jgi:hypothetical protein
VSRVRVFGQSRFNWELELEVDPERYARIFTLEVVPDPRELAKSRALDMVRGLLRDADLKPHAESHVVLLTTLLTDAKETKDAGPVKT